MRSSLILICVIIGIPVLAQISSFPNDEGFEDAFVEGTDIEFISNWIGNTVASSNRIFQSSDSRSGSSAMAVQPIGSFDGEVLISLNLTNLTNCEINFYAKSNKNGTGDRAALVYFSTSIDGGISFGTPEQIGNNATFPNSSGEIYRAYSYSLDVLSDKQTSVVVKVLIERDESGSGNAAEFLMDDVVFSADPFIDTDPPTIQSATAISDTEVDVKFGENVDASTAQNKANYAIDGSVTVTNAVLDGSDNSLVHLTADALTNGSTYSLTINNVEDENGNAIVANSQASFEYLVFEEADEFDVVINEFMADPNPVVDALPDAEYVELYNQSAKYLNLENWMLDGQSLPAFVLAPDSYVLIVEDDDVGLFGDFPEVLAITTLSLNNTTTDDIILLDDNGVQIHSITFLGSTGGTSTELINPNDPCISIESYALSTNAEGGTPGAQNSVFDDTPDVEAPSVQSYSFSNSLTINFSEVMDVASLAAGTYSVKTDLTIDQINVSGSFPTSIEITFIEAISAGVLYEFTLSNVADCSGNLIAKTTITFSLGRPPAFNELIITEVMFDPDPQEELPNLEFIEIHNTTSDILTTAGVSLTDASTTITLPAQMLNSGDYYVLTTTSGASEFSGNVIGVPDFPSLNNSGEQLVLSLNSELIFSLTYDPDWHDEEKADGGYSLEMKDVTNPCFENGNNWISSEDARGGTPGLVNSISEILPDNFGPEIISTIALTADSIRVIFSEKIHPLSALTASISLSPTIGVRQVYFDLFNPYTLAFKLSAALEQNVPYTLNIENVTDCSGNEIEQGEIFFALPVQANEEEIKLSEVLFNPRSNGVDFVEIYNTSDNYISLKNWKLATINDEDEVDDEVVITTDELVINPKQYLVFTTDSDVLLTNYPQGIFNNFFQMASLSSYSNEEGTVLLIDQSEVIKETLYYHEDYHYNLLKSVDGVSLERVSYKAPTKSADNWRSAASTEGFATPGYANSQSFVNDKPVGRVTASPEVFIPGNAGSGRDFTTINYQFDQSGNFANVNIYDQTGRLVKNLAQGALLSTSGFLRWDGDTNDGKITRMGYYLIIFEIYGSSGNSEIIKETVVVGRDF